MGIEEYLAPGEEILFMTRGRSSSLACTDRRIIYSVDSSNSFKDIQYPSISSIEWDRVSHRRLGRGGALFFLLGVALYFVGGYFSGEEILFRNVGTLLAFLGAVGLVFFLILRPYRLTLFTEKEEIVYDFSGSEAKEMLAEMERIIRGRIG
jgi:hypothetical protein